jgi:hypothetical protein
MWMLYISRFISFLVQIVSLINCQVWLLDYTWKILLLLYMRHHRLYSRHCFWPKQLHASLRNLPITLILQTWVTSCGHSCHCFVLWTEVKEWRRDGTEGGSKDARKQTASEIQTGILLIMSSRWQTIANKLNQFCSMLSVECAAVT